MMKDKRDVQESRNESPGKRSGIGSMMGMHLICCGLPLIILLFGVAGIDILLQVVNNPVIPGGGILAATLLVWFFYRRWKKERSKSTKTIGIFQKR